MLKTNTRFADVQLSEDMPALESVDNRLGRFLRHRATLRWNKCLTDTSMWER
jgi:hypothetical protein